MKTLTMLFTLLFVSTGCYAAIAGKPVILVHGFQFTDLQNTPPNEAFLLQQSRNYFSDYWTSRADEHHYYSSADRVSGGVKDQFKRHFERLEASGLCIQGCVWVTHSTGDLVLRDALNRLGQWGIDRNRVKVLAVIDFAGAGGGTELADLAANVASGGGFVDFTIRQVVRAFLGVDPSSSGLGVVNDLRPTNARRIAQGNQGVPRLRFVGTGSEFAGITKPFIQGEDDSVVPLHSACGSNRKGDYNSCSSGIRNNGVLRSARAPSALLANHFPVLIGERVNHSQHINNDRVGGVYAPIINNVSANGLVIDFAESTGRRWWSWGARVRSVDNSNRKSMSANVYDTLNN
ncbi:hypothetical protein ACFO4O_13325 [Glaciecola siphonariae]|uniref:Alpha/beta hydrolase n=1 Tax=Glaciecola siphonariae TaxID=521012 RepID=A0ABV9LY63_9ALTE